MRGKSFLAGVAVLAAGLIFVTGGGAATMTTVTLTVNSTADPVSPDGCTIANQQEHGNVHAARRDHRSRAPTVRTTRCSSIKLAAKTYTLSQGTLDVDAATANTGNIVQIVGATKTTGKKKHKKTVPASIIDGSGNTKSTSVFEIYSPTQMSNVVITGGSGDEGGGIYMESDSRHGELDRPAQHVVLVVDGQLLHELRGRGRDLPRRVERLPAPQPLQHDGDQEHRLVRRRDREREPAGLERLHSLVAHRQEHRL